MTPVTGLARLPGRILWCVHMGNFSSVDHAGWIQETQPKWWNINLYYSRLSELCRPYFINKAISHTAEVEIHTRPKLYHFGHYLVKAKLFCRKCFVLVTGLECSYGKIFIPVTEISVGKTETSVTGPARPLIFLHPLDIFTKKRVARRDLGNRASPVGRAHMKRP